MTHDELLAKIDSQEARWSDWKTYNALRAVVEIIKDYNDGQVRVNEEFNQGVLSLSNVIKDAIEKELA